MSADDMYERLRPPPPTPPDEICSHPPSTALKLMGLPMTFNPVHCLDCNLEVLPEQLGMGSDLVQELAIWCALYRAIDSLELDSGDYETWARTQLLDLESPVHADGRVVAGQLDELRRCYYWIWQPQADDRWEPPSVCPLCGEPLERYERGAYPQLVCEQDSLVFPGS